MRGSVRRFSDPPRTVAVGPGPVRWTLPQRFVQEAGASRFSFGAGVSRDSRAEASLAR